MNRYGTALGVLGILTLAANCRADDWPQFRGPKRDATSKEKNLLKSWPKEGPKLLWKVKDAGFGYGSVSVADGRILLVASRGKEEEYIAALSAKDGSPIWTAKLGKVGNPDQVPAYSGARSTPTIDGQLAYALGSDGDLVCVEAATGKERWRKSLRNDFGGKPGVWAYSESPLVDGNRVIVAPGGPGAAVVALDKKTGATLWKAAVPGDDIAA
jgi:outer membrane protein assembly factor BamB